MVVTEVDEREEHKKAALDATLGRLSFLHVHQVYNYAPPDLKDLWIVQQPEQEKHEGAEGVEHGRLRVLGKL